ncbi:MAG: hypothetical protein IRZ33_08870 [Alicyclobacillaceae bacterium]|nr:hypothetical protein [Alicyclobacillaceae bacterium]
MSTWVPALPPAQAAARPGMSASVGFAGYYAEDQWVPVDVVLHNPGPRQRAELVVSVNYPLNDNRVELGSLHWLVVLPARGWVHKEIAVPGHVLAANAPPALYCVVAGRTVARADLSGNPLGNVSLVAMLSPYAQDAQFLTGSTGPDGDPVLPVAVSPLTFPASANLLNGLTAVVARPDVLGALNRSQYAALTTWVKLGGLLVVAGTDGGADVLLPMRPGPAQSVSGMPLVHYAGSAALLPHKILAASGGLRPGAELLAGSARTPLLAVRDVGRGAVVQTAFDPQQSALLGWPGNVSLWTKVLREGNPEQSALPRLLDPNGVLALAAVSDALSPLRVPSLRVWASVFALYALVCGPLLFVWLRRSKRESWAWVLLPAISVLTTACIYGFGASQRPAGILTDGVGVLDLSGDGEAEAYGIRAFMAPFVTSAQAATHSSMLVLPLAEQNVRQLGEAFVRVSDHNVVRFTDVARWGVRYVYAAGAVAGQGRLDARLEAMFGLIGTVRNETPYPLHAAALYWNGQLYELGDLRPGQSITLGGRTPSQDVGSNWLLAYAAYNRDIMHGPGRPLGSWAATLLSGQVNPNQAMLVATTDAQMPALPRLQTAGAVASDQTVVMVRQFVPVRSYPLGGSPYD